MCIKFITIYNKVKKRMRKLLIYNNNNYRIKIMALHFDVKYAVQRTCLGLEIEVLNSNETQLARANRFRMIDSNVRREEKPNYTVR